jgi:hypothetical protein
MARTRLSLELLGDKRKKKRKMKLIFWEVGGRRRREKEKVEGKTEIKERAEILEVEGGV